MLWLSSLSSSCASGTRCLSIRVDTGISCVKNCLPQDLSCLQDLVKTITYSFVEIPGVKRLYQPLRITTLYGFTFYSLPIDINYQIISGNQRSYFDIQQLGSGQCYVRMVKATTGPYEETIGIAMNINSRQRGTIAKHLAYINVYISPFAVDGSV